MKAIRNFLAILFCTLLSITSVAYAEEEEQEYAMKLTCATVEDHQQELRWCKTFEKALISSDWLKPRGKDRGSYLLVVVVTEFCERTQTLGASTTVVFASPWFAGQYPWLMSNLKVIEPGDWESIAEELVDDMEVAFDLSRDGLISAMESLHREKKNYKSVGGGDERYFEDDPIDRAWPDLRPELCRGTDIMFSVSSGG